MISSAPCTMEDTEYLDQTGSISVATVACRTRTDSVWQSSYYLRSLKVGAGHCLQVDKSKGMLRITMITIIITTIITIMIMIVIIMIIMIIII